MDKLAQNHRSSVICAQILNPVKSSDVSKAVVHKDDSACIFCYVCDLFQIIIERHKTAQRVR